MQRVWILVLLLVGIFPSHSLLPSVPPVRASNTCTANPCNIDNQYLGNCLLQATGDKSTSLGPGGLYGLFAPTERAFAVDNSSCDGTGLLFAYASAGTMYGSASAHARIVFTDTIVVPSIGQSDTHVSISGSYLLNGYMLTSGEGTTFQSSAETDVMLSLCGNGQCFGPYPQALSPSGVAPACNQIDAPTKTYGPVCLNDATNLGQSEQRFSLGQFHLPGPGTYTFTLAANTNVTAWNIGYGATFAKSCFSYTVPSCPNSAPLNPSSYNCPPITGFTPCFYVKWTSTSYQLSFDFSGNPDFSISLTDNAPNHQQAYIDNFFGFRYQLNVNSLNGFSGWITLNYVISPPGGRSVVNPTVFFYDPHAGIVPNGTAVYISPFSTPYSLILGMEPCVVPNPDPRNPGPNPLYICNLDCVNRPWSGECPANMLTAPATPGTYTVEIVGTSGIRHHAGVSFPILDYDFSTIFTVSSYSNGILTVNSTIGNIGNASPVGNVNDYRTTFNAAWGENVSYYLDGTLKSTVSFCGQGSAGAAGPFLYYDCPPGKTFNLVWNTPAAQGAHNITVTAREVISNCNACSPPGPYFDANPYNNRFDSDFRLVPPMNNPPLQVNPGGSTGEIITAAAFPDFDGTISIAGVAPQGWGLSFDTSSIHLSPGQNLNVTATLTVPSSATLGSYSITVNGASTVNGGTVTHSITIPVRVLDFGLSASGTIDTTPNSSKDSVLTVSSIGGFSGTVTLTAAPPTGFWAGFTASSFNVSSDGSTTSVMFAFPNGSPSPGAYTIPVAATSGSISHTVPVSLYYAGEFSISVSPSSTTIRQGGTGTAIITVTSLYGFNDGVALGLSTALPSGISATISPSQVNVSPNTPGSAALTITASTTAPTGAFTICASGVYWFPDNGYSINHQACITVTVTTATILSNNPSSSDWTVLSGTWTQQSGVMDGSGNYPEIKSTNSFAAARTVTVRARSITTGPNGWNTAWIRAKYIDDNNKITVFLKTDGCLEMDYKQNGVITYYASSQLTGQSPTAWHTFNVIFSGNNIKVQLDGVTYFDLTNSAFGTFGAANVVLTSSSSESQFDSLTIS